MNCIEFENIVNDLAHGRIDGRKDRETQNDGLTHAESCVNCALRLENERALSVLLRSLAAIDEIDEIDEDEIEEIVDGSAPSATESALLAAFRRKAAENAGSALRTRRQRGRWAMAAAAMILLAVGVFGIIRTTRSVPVKVTIGKGREPGRELISAPVVSEVVSGKIAATPERRPIRSREKMRRKAQSQIAERERARPVLIRDEMTLYADDADVVTDFIPLTYGDSLKPIEKGELIRVRMPRTALLKFGLPMNVESAGVPVKADLLVGEDGMARAIRFVR
jgi:hypothetical protein